MTGLGPASAQQTSPAGGPPPAGMPAAPEAKADEPPTATELFLDEAKAKLAQLKSCPPTSRSGSIC